MKPKSRIARKVEVNLVDYLLSIPLSPRLSLLAIYNSVWYLDTAFLVSRLSEFQIIHFWLNNFLRNFNIHRIFHTNSYFLVTFADLSNESKQSFHTESPGIQMTVCLSVSIGLFDTVCLSVCVESTSGRNRWPILTKPCSLLNDNNEQVVRASIWSVFPPGALGTIGQKLLKHGKSHDRLNSGTHEERETKRCYE